MHGADAHPQHLLAQFDESPLSYVVVHTAFQTFTHMFDTPCRAAEEYFASHKSLMVEENHNAHVPRICNSPCLLDVPDGDARGRRSEGTVLLIHNIFCHSLMKAPLCYVVLRITFQTLTYTFDTPC